MQAAVGLRSHLQQRRPSQREMAEDKLAIVPGARQSARVTIDAQNRGRDLASVLAHQEPPGLFALGTVIRYFPVSVDGRRAR